MCVAPVLVLSCAAVVAQDSAREDHKVKTAAEAFKNIQVLKDVPEDQWYDTMAFIAGSLGVTCDHCHTSSFEKDDGNTAKLRARLMMRMVDEINQKEFDGKRIITCNTCHRGNVKPQAGPTSDMEHWMKAAEDELPVPRATDVIANYRQATGLSSRKTPVRQFATFQIETYGGKGAAKTSSLELLVGGPDRVRMTNRDGETATLYLKNGHDAWVKDSKGWHAMDGGEANELEGRASVLEPDQIGEGLVLKNVFKERVYGQPAFVVEADSKGERKQFFFDTGTKLLLRQRIFFKTYYADGSVDIEYSDYKKVGGFMLPFTVRVINAGGEGLSIRRATSRKVDVSAKDSDFARGAE